MQRERERERVQTIRKNRTLLHTCCCSSSSCCRYSDGECDVGIVVVIAIVCVGFFDNDNERRIDHGFWDGQAGGRGKTIANVNHEEREGG
jgi:hypothetical protein